ncbi:hypothetical protein M433DRAFT_360741 [Acidomyces richmondensis BFW]|nr:MAG: hypothetical protein FE78DRAFT_194117 [Acidomyces sp. 'richmondensis']KYG49016.1 hypothetical protein M433DRAFT_360741 [Acidomyces richmondensis BFW]
MSVLRAFANEASKMSAESGRRRAQLSHEVMAMPMCRWRCLDVPDDVPDSAARGRRSPVSCRGKKKKKKAAFAIGCAEPDMKLCWRYGAEWMTRRRAVDSKTIRGARKDVVVCGGRRLTLRENWMVHGSPGFKNRGHEEQKSVPGGASLPPRADHRTAAKTDAARFGATHTPAARYREGGERGGQCA